VILPLLLALSLSQPNQETENVPAPETAPEAAAGTAKKASTLAPPSKAGKAAPTAPAPKPVPADKAAESAVKSLSFGSKRLTYRWDALLPVDLDVDGLKVKTVFFNRREIKSGIFKGADFGLRGQLEVTNTSSHPKVPGFAVAVFDADDRLLGVASGGTKIGTVKPGETETFDLNFSYVTERMPLGAYAVLSLELRN